MATQWLRQFNTTDSWNLGNWHFAAIPAGDTLVRIRFSWGFYIDTPTLRNMQNVADNLLAFGWVTTVGDGSEPVPSAKTSPGDAAPPLQRWLWWECRQPVVSAIDERAGVIAWRDSGPQDRMDGRGQVLASPLPAGEFLNLWASWEGNYGLSAEDNPSIWMSISCLVHH
jgi:hypothetical protein